MSIFKPKDILQPPPEGSEIKDEYLIVGKTRRSNRGKKSEVLKVQKKLNQHSGRKASYRNLADHEIEHTEEDVDGAGLKVVGGVRKGRLASGSKFTQTNIGLVPVGLGEERTQKDHIKMAKAPKVMSERDKKNVIKLSKKS